MNTVAILLPILFNIVASAPYIYLILKRRAHPSRASWIVWSVLDTITLGSMLAKHTANSQIASGWLLSALITVSVMHTSRAKPWQTRERLYLVGGCIGVALWVLTSNPLWALIISLTVIEFALIPTLENVWKEPWHEPPLPWLLGGLGSLPVLLSLEHWTVASATQPILWLVNNVSVTVIILLRRQHLAPRPA